MREVMVANDQLKIAMHEQEAFLGFEEGELTFPPTYKFDSGSDTYDTSSKARIPSWTDRILWKASKRVSLRKYSSVPGIHTSDHKPVFAIFHVAVSTDITEEALA